MIRLQNREMRNVRPALFAAQAPATKLIVEFPHPVSRALHLDKNRRRGRKKRLDFSQFDIERNGVAASFLQKFQSSRFASDQFARRQDRHMGGHVSNGRVEFPAQLFDEFANRIPNVGDQCVAWSGA